MDIEILYANMQSASFKIYPSACVLLPHEAHFLSDELVALTQLKKDSSKMQQPHCFILKKAETSLEIVQKLLGPHSHPSISWINNLAEIDYGFENEDYFFPHMLTATHASLHHTGTLSLYSFLASISEIRGSITGNGLPYTMPLSVGVYLTGTVNPFWCPSDLVIKLLDYFYNNPLPYKNLEFFGEGLNSLSLQSRLLINNFCYLLDAQQLYWPLIDKENLMSHTQQALKITNEKAFQKMMTECGLTNTMDHKRRYTHVVEIDLSKLRSGQALFRKPLLADDSGDKSVDNASPYTQTTGPLMKRPLRAFRVHFCPMGTIEKDEEWLCFAVLIQKAIHEGLSLEVPCHWSVHKDDPLLDAFRSLCADNLKTLNIHEVPHKSIALSASVYTKEEESLMVSNPFAFLAALTGFVGMEEVGDLSGGITLKDIWPTRDELRTFFKKLCTQKKPHNDTLDKKRSSDFLKKEVSFFSKKHKNPPLLSTENTEHITLLPVLRGHSFDVPILNIDKPLSRSFYNELSSKKDMPKLITKDFLGYPGVLNQLLIDALKKYLLFDKNIMFTSKKSLQPLAIVGKNSYGRGFGWQWLAEALSLVGVRFVLAQSFTPLLQRALTYQGIFPLVFQKNDIESFIDFKKYTHASLLNSCVIDKNKTTSLTLKLISTKGECLVTTCSYHVWKEIDH